MDGWLKSLVASACVVIIAGGGYFAWSEYRRSKIETARQSEASKRAELQQERQRCLDALKPPRVTMLGEEKRYRDKCRQDGFITYSEQIEAGG
ncbi:hypothetical protein [Agrobacterium tumefaciens]|uniref:Uncharacterized protein n=1 Tax=Agrobacterium tumefaciens TaxID=358 RepID=A0A546XRY2_AGRTU|nr:hypothetical protein [Agrobacterium tumefaciens]NSX90145.1 hypothetical protein [Agrobacterium tumefaciens]TRB03486.1 hypothetical protein EXN61_21730 [Agrobacterium tumefaciens]